MDAYRNPFIDKETCNRQKLADLQKQLEARQGK
jgi:hypothetical protein